MVWRRLPYDLFFFVIMLSWSTCRSQKHYMIWKKPTCDQLDSCIVWKKFVDDLIYHVNWNSTIMRPISSMWMMWIFCIHCPEPLCLNTFDMLFELLLCCFSSYIFYGIGPSCYEIWGPEVVGMCQSHFCIIWVDVVDGLN